jgi:hypothetical protein
MTEPADQLPDDLTSAHAMILAERAARRDAEAVAARAQAVNSHSDALIARLRQFERCPADPVRKCGAVKIDTLSTHDLGLPIKRQVIGIFGHQHMRDSRLGRQSGVDQSCRRWSLRYAVSASTTGIFWTPGDDDTELRRDDIQSFGYVLTYAM